MARIVAWLATMAAVIVAAEVALGAMAARLAPEPDPRFGFDFAYGLTLPVRIVNDAAGAWPIVFVFWLAIGMLAFAGVRLARAIADDGRVGVTTILAAMFGLGALLTLFPIAMGGDLYAYVAYGRLYGLYQLNPYHLTQPVHIGGDAILEQCLHFYRNPPPGDNYGPLWTLLAGMIGRLESLAPLILQIWTQRFVGLLCALVTAVGLWRLWRNAPEAERKQRVAAFAFHPLVLYEAAASGHNDAIMVAFGVWAFALADEYPLIAGVLIGAACAVKYVAVIAVPFLAALIWKRHRAGASILAVAAAAAVAIISFFPFWTGLSSLASLFGDTSFSRTSPTWLIEVPLLKYSPGAPPVIGSLSLPSVIGITALGGLACITVWSTVQFAKTGSAANVWRSITALIWSLPNMYPWYLLWLSPALSSRGAWSKYVWWFGLLGMLHYAEDVPRLPESPPEYRFLMDFAIASTLAFLIIPILIAREGREASRWKTFGGGPGRGTPPMRNTPKKIGSGGVVDQARLESV